MAAAKRFLDKAIEADGDPKEVTMDKSGDNESAINAIDVDRNVRVLVRRPA